MHSEFPVGRDCSPAVKRRPSGGGSHRGDGVLADADSVDDLKRRLEPVADWRGVVYCFAGLAKGLFVLYLAVIIGPSLVGHGTHHRSRSRAT